MSEEIRPGDVVQLKSGGPPMTAVSVGEAQASHELSVWCEWFDAQKKPQKEFFSLVAVRKYVPLKRGGIVVRR